MRGSLRTFGALFGLGLGLLAVPLLLSVMGTPGAMDWDPDVAAAKAELWLQTQTVLAVVGVSFIGASVIFGFKDTFSLRRELKAPSIPCEPGEHVLKAVPGFHVVAREPPAQGIWYLTNRRLRFRGARTALGGEDERLTFALADLETVEPVKRGVAELTFAGRSVIGEPVTKKVRIAVSNLADFQDTLQRAKADLARPPSES